MKITLETEEEDVNLFAQLVAQAIEKAALGNVGFKRPPLPEVEAFMLKVISDKGIDAEARYEAEKFLAHYSAKGWMSGKDPVTDWKGLAYMWLLKEKERQKEKEKKPEFESSFDIDEFASLAMERRM